MTAQSFDALLARHAGWALSRQDILQQMIGRATRWNFDLAAGKLTFDNGREFGIGVLGTYIAAKGTWQWSWANDRLATLPEGTIAPALELLEIGERDGVAALKTEEIRADVAACSRLALLSIGLLRRGAFYRGDFDGGAAYLAIEPTQVLSARTNPRRMAYIFHQLTKMSLEPRLAVEGFLLDEGYDVTCEGSGLRAEREGHVIRFRFDDDGDIADMDLQLPRGAKPLLGDSWEPMA